MPETEGPWFRRLGLAERQEIERLLDANASMSESARKLGRSVSTITREITRNRRDDGYRVSPVSITRLCVHVRTCQVKGLCKGCWNRRCAGCRDVRCTNTCKRYERDLQEEHRSAFLLQRLRVSPGMPQAPLPLQRTVRAKAFRRTPGRVPVRDRHHL